MELTSVATQTVAANQNVLFNETVIPGNCSIQHRNGSGLVNMRGVCSSQCRARFKVSFGANIAVPADGTAGAISLALAINGEGVNSTTMISTPAAVSQYNNVFSSIYIDVPKGCCAQVSVKNMSTVNISVANANIIVERVA